MPSLKDCWLNLWMTGRASVM